VLDLPDHVTQQDLLPLPLVFLSVEDMARLLNEHELGRFAPSAKVWASQGELPVQHLEWIHNWVWCMILGLNFLHLGLGSDHFSSAACSGPPSPA
jgi:hypothetical protein